MADLKLRIKKANGEWLELGKRYIESFSSLSQTTSDPTSIQYGVLSKSGDIALTDFDGKIQKLVEDNEIPMNNVPTKIIINQNTTLNHETQSSDYYNTEMKANIQLYDSLYKLKKVKFSREFYYFGDTETKVCLYEILEFVVADSNLQNVMGISSGDFLENLLSDSIRIKNKKIQIKEYFEKLTVVDGTAYVDCSCLYDLLEKVGQAFQLMLIETSNGNIKYVSNMPIAHIDDTFIKVPKRLLISQPKTNLFVQNQVESITISKKSINQTFADIANADISLELDDATTLENLEFGQIIEDDNYKYLCFFYSVTSSNPILANTIRNDGTKAISIRVEDATSAVGNSFPTFYPVSGTKNTFNFNEYLGSSVLLYETCTKNSFVIACAINIAGLDVNTLKSVKINIRPRSLVFNNTEITYGGEQGENVSTLEYENEFIGENWRYYPDLQEDKYIGYYDLITNNILANHSNPLKVATVDIFCNDMYSKDGKVVKSWDNGEILETNDLVFFDDDKYIDDEQRYWQITGRNFKWSGSPTMSLEIREINGILCDIVSNAEENHATTIITRLSSKNPVAPIGKIDISEPIYYGDKLKLEVIANEGYTIIITNINAGTSEYDPDSNTFTIKSNILINVEVSESVGWHTVFEGSIGIEEDPIGFEKNLAISGSSIKANIETRYSGYVILFIDGREYVRRNFTNVTNSDVYQILGIDQTDYSTYDVLQINVLNPVKDGNARYSSSVAEDSYFSTNDLTFTLVFEKIEQYY